MARLFRYLGYLAAVGLAGVYLFLALAGPQPLTSIPKVRNTLQEMERENKRLEEEIRKRQDYIRELDNSTELQDREIRRRLKKQLPGETDVRLPVEPSAPGAR
jgi:predicted RND superfamily exporter protein